MLLFPSEKILSILKNLLCYGCAVYFTSFGWFNFFVCFDQTQTEMHQTVYLCWNSLNFIPTFLFVAEKKSSFFILHNCIFMNLATTFFPCHAWLFPKNRFHSILIWNCKKMLIHYLSLSHTYQMHPSLYCLLLLKHFKNYFFTKNH